MRFHFRIHRSWQMRSQVFCTPNDANLRQTTLQNGLGTAFGTAR
jgi:hypothetical protein